MTLNNLTREQVWLLNNLWHIQTMEELRSWQATLPKHQFEMVECLVEMLKHESLEEDLDRSDFGEALSVLEKLRKAK